MYPSTNSGHVTRSCGSTGHSAAVCGAPVGKTCTIGVMILQRDCPLSDGRSQKVIYSAHIIPKVPYPTAKNTIDI